MRRLTDDKLPLIALCLPVVSWAVLVLTRVLIGPSEVTAVGLRVAVAITAGSLGLYMVHLCLIRRWGRVLGLAWAVLLIIRLGSSEAGVPAVDGLFLLLTAALVSYTILTGARSWHNRG